MTEAQIEQAVEQSQRFSWIFEAIPVVIPALLSLIVAGALWTAALAAHGLGSLLPGVWLLLYGTAVTAAGALSVRIVPVMGIAFMALGVAGLILAPGYANELTAAGFGGLHVVFGVAIARKYGG